MRKEVFFKCPVCNSALKEEGGTYICENRHSFDKAAAGYVNLLHTGGSKGKIHGDSPDMVAARRRFLSAGYYACLQKALYAEVTSVADDTSFFLDAGCGEGYYTNCFDEYFKTGIGVDISKDAVKKGAKSAKNIKYCVGSVFQLPVFDSSVDVLTSVFAPYSSEEFQRVVKPGGYVFAVVPGKEHLWGMKNVLYEKPYYNDECGYDLPGFTNVSKVNVDDNIVVENEYISDLFKMTPYFWKTGKEKAELLSSMTKLETKISFVIYCYRRNKLGE